MLFDQYPFRQFFRGVLIHDRHRRLQNDGTRVRAFVHKMDCAAGKLGSGRDDLLVHRMAEHALSAKGRQQGRMNIHDFQGIALHQHGSEDSHVTGQANQVDVLLREMAGQFLIIGDPVRKLLRKNL